MAVNIYHQQTVHTWELVHSNSGRMDWSRQPEVVKAYPAAYTSVFLDDYPDLKSFFSLSAGITAKKTYPGGEYLLRANPSAGALYPCELYVQARSAAGLDDGIYHYEPLTGGLRLLRSLSEDEGLECCCPDHSSVRGLVLLVTAIYYRSSWKYRNRAFRYCLLDSGHLLGAIEAAAAVSEYPCCIITQVDREKLHQLFGFQQQELVMAMVVCGTLQEKKVDLLEMELPFVNGSGCFVGNAVIEAAYRREREDLSCSKPTESAWRYSSSDALPRIPLKEAIVQRRSIRAFSKEPISEQEYAAVLKAVEAACPIDCDEKIRIMAVVNRVEGIEPGVYEGGNCLRTGSVANMAGYLCLEQALGSDSGATVFLTASATAHYLPLMLKAGFIGQRVYLAATMLGLGCSGIGAFYDAEVAAFLGTDDMVLYALAFGR